MGWEQAVAAFFLSLCLEDSSMEPPLGIAARLECMVPGHDNPTISLAYCIVYAGLSRSERGFGLSCYACDSDRKEPCRPEELLARATACCRALGQPCALEHGRLRRCHGLDQAAAAAHAGADKRPSSRIKQTHGQAVQSNRQTAEQWSSGTNRASRADHNHRQPP